MVFGDNKEGEQMDKLVFRKGLDLYELEFRRVEGDELRPCVMMYWSGDEVEILPGF